MKISTKLKCLGMAVAAMFTTAASAQLCNGSGRYFDEVFTSLDTASVTYSTTNQKMTIYQPSGDTVSQRPLIIFAHGGSFIGGDRYEGTVTSLAKNFAKRGYVTASIDYRLGSVVDMLAAASAYDVVVKAMSDGKAAVRYFRQDAATNNNYRVNPDLVFAGGNSAGAVLYVHVGFVDSLNEVTTADIKSAMNNNGGFEGNSGNDGYPSNISAIIDLAGGINDTTWISEGNTPIVSFQGTEDATVPYNCAKAQGGVSPAILCGTGAMQPRIERLGIDNDVLTFPGDGHVPWEGNATKFNQVDELTKTFLYRQVCKYYNALSVSDVETPYFVSIYPNPNHGEFTLKTDRVEDNSVIEVFNQMGQLVYKTNLEFPSAILKLDNVALGIYTVRISAGGQSKSISKMIVR